MRSTNKIIIKLKLKRNGRELNVTFFGMRGRGESERVRAELLKSRMGRALVTWLKAFCGGYFELFIVIHHQTVWTFGAVN